MTMATANTAQPERGSDLFFQSLIEGYLGNKRFVERPWLEERIHEGIADRDRPFVLITAEPGAGKSAILARLASRNPAWPRYFIRRDQLSPLGPPGARSFLFQVGLQLAARYPEIFRPERLQVTIVQQARKVAPDGKLIAGSVKELLASPFVTAVLTIRQQVEEAGGEVTGLHVDKWVADPRLIEVSDLQALAIIDPATALAETAGGTPVVVLIDALDELRYQPENDSLLDWLANCPELPANVRLVITSRPDDALLRNFRNRQGARIHEIYLEWQRPEVIDRVAGDLRAYASRLAESPEVQAAVAAAGQTRESFESAAVDKAEGNLGYLDALGRAIDRAAIEKDGNALRQAIEFSRLPGGLRSLYGYFLQQIQARVGDRCVRIEYPKTGDSYLVSAWSEVYLPILGVLTVAAEPLAATQIRDLAGIAAEETEVFAALNRLRQFLDEAGGCYRFYHGTLPEFLSDPATGNDLQTRELYQDPVRWNRRISNSYRRIVGGWQGAHWEALDDYGRRHLSAHLFTGSRPARFDELFDAYAGGFLEAKHRVSAGPADLHDDWRLILDAAREIADFARFVHYGYRISSQYSEVAHLLSRNVAAAAARIAIRCKDEAALRRMASAAALIPVPVGRANAVLSLLEELLSGMPDSELIAGLIGSMEALLPTLDPGAERDYRRVSYIEILARRQHPEWRQLSNEALAGITELPARMRLWSLLAKAAAAAGGSAEAAQAISSAIEECRAFATPENVVGDVLHLVLGAERVNPLDVLAEALANLAPGLAALGDAECAAAIDAMSEQERRLSDPGTVLNLQVGIFDSLTAAGHTTLANAYLLPILDAWLAQPNGLGLLMLLPAAVAIGDPERTAAVVGQIVRGARESNPFGWFFSSISLIVSVTEKSEGARDALAPVLGTMDQMEPPPADQALFPYLAIMACGWTCVGDTERARTRLRRMLSEVSPAAFEISQYPEQNRVQASLFSIAWLAACKIGDRDLLNRTLDWLFVAVPRAVGYTEAPSFWVGAIANLKVAPDPKAAGEALDRLRMPLVESRNAPMFHATALLQLADGWALLRRPEESLRLVRYARDTYGPVWSFHLLCWAARLLAEQGDLAGSRDLLAAAIPGLASIPGLNIRDDAVGSVARALRALGKAGAAGAASALPLFGQLLEIGRAIDRGEYSLSAESAVVQAAADCGLPVESAPLADRAKRYVKGTTGVGRFRPVLSAIAALHAVAQAGRGKESAAAAKSVQDLLEKVQDSLQRAEVKSDLDRARLCEEYATLVNLDTSTGVGGLDERLHERCLREAALVADAVYAVQAAGVMAHVAAWRNRPAEAAQWLERAVAAYAGVQEVYQVNDSVDRILKPWGAIADLATRTRLLDRIQPVIWRIPDLYARDVAKARIVMGMWDDPVRAAGLLSRVVTGSGASAILEVLRDSDRMPEGIAPGILYDVVGACTRQARPGFAGEALAATQAAAHHKLFPDENLAAALGEIEAMMQEICGAAPK
jgi:hypothetical protein